MESNYNLIYFPIKHDEIIKEAFPHLFKILPNYVITCNIEIFSTPKLINVGLSCIKISGCSKEILNNLDDIVTSFIWGYIISRENING